MKGLHNIRLATFTMPLLLVAIAPAAYTQAARSLEPVHTEAPRVADNGKYYAIVIGINNYPSPLKPLETAVKDATAVATVLTKSYGFQVNLLLNQDATRVNILNAINRFRDRLNENDNLLIYYAGHGYSDHAADKAYWLPIDADSIYSSNRIIADELTTDIRVQNARHVLVISDSCYSGGLSRDADFPTESAGQSVFLNRMLKSRSRTLMASGGDEPVSDSGTDGHSVFAYALLRAFEQQRQSVFTASDLFYGSVRQQVAGKSDQVPQYSVIRNSNHDEGDFVFVKKDEQLAKSPAVSSTPTTDQPLVTQSPSDSFVVLKAPGKAISDADLAQIHQLLTQYEIAVNNRDLKQLKTIWPEIPPKKVEQYKTIPKGARISITITMATLLEGNDNAIVKCKQNYWLDGKTQDDNVTFYVGRLNSGWIINQIPSSN